VTKRRRKPIIWPDYRTYLITRFTHTRDAEEFTRRTGQPSNMISDGQLRGFLIDHARWGVAARPELWPTLRPHIYLPRSEEPWNLEVVITDGRLIAQTIGDPRHTRAGIRSFADLWGPHGPLEIPDEEWRQDPDFQKWLDERRTK